MIYQTTDSNERNDGKLLMPDARLQVQYQRTREMTIDDLGSGKTDFQRIKKIAAEFEVGK